MIQKLGKQQWTLQRSQSLGTEHEMRGRVLQSQCNLDEHEMPTVFPPVEEAHEIKEFKFSVFWGEIHLPLTSTISAKRSLKKAKAFFLCNFIPPFQNKTYDYFMQCSITGLLGLGKLHSQLFHNFFAMSRGF